MNGFYIIRKIEKAALKIKENIKLLTRYLNLRIEFLISVFFFITSSCVIGTICVSLFLLEKKALYRKNQEEIKYISERIFSDLSKDFYKINEKLKAVVQDASCIDECNNNVMANLKLSFIDSYRIICKKKKEKITGAEIIFHKNYHKYLEIRFTNREKDFEGTVVFSINDVIKKFDLRRDEFQQLVWKIKKRGINEILFPDRKVKEIFSKNEILVTEDVIFEVGYDMEKVLNSVEEIYKTKFFLFLVLESCALFLFCFLKGIYKRTLYFVINKEKLEYKKKAKEYQMFLEEEREVRGKMKQSYIEQIKYYRIMHDEIKSMLINAVKKINRTGEQNEEDIEHLFTMNAEIFEEGVFDIKEVFKNLLKLVSYQSYRKKLKVIEKIEISKATKIYMNKYVFYMLLYSAIYMIFRDVSHGSKIEISVQESNEYLKFNFCINVGVIILDMKSSSSVFVDFDKIDRLLKIYDSGINIEDKKGRFNIEIKVLKKPRKYAVKDLLSTVNVNDTVH